MHDCDTTLKELLMASVNTIPREIGSDGMVARWLNVELPKVRNQKVDLLMELTTGGILHIELQSTNDARMPLRMLEYGISICGQLGTFPRQLVLYVGNDRLRMGSGFQEEGIDYRYQVVDLRDVSGEALLESEHIADNLLAVPIRLSWKGTECRFTLTLWTTRFRVRRLGRDWSRVGSRGWKKAGKKAGRKAGKRGCEPWW